MITKYRFLAFLALPFLLALQAQSAELHIQPGADSNHVIFRSAAPMESFEGTTQEVKGEIRVDLDDLINDFEVRVEVDLASLKTGMSLRDKHMRENHLETDTHPTVVFSGTELLAPSLPKLAVGSPVSFRVRGDFDLHGETRQIEVPIEATRLDEKSVHIRADFSVKLSDYGIKRPKFLFMKLGEEQQVQVDVVATTR